jgi:amino acid adenylation domain-containing protein/FkbH-like protein
MGRANYTENPTAENGTGKRCAAEIVESGESLVQPRMETEWPLSFAQQRLWFLDQLEPGKAAYSMPLVARLRGALNLTALQKAVDAIVRRHESLRTRFVSVNGRAAQIVDDDCRLRVRVDDLSALTASEREVECKRRVRDEINRPFNLGEAPLARVLLLQFAEEEYVLVLTMHHIISDEWSLNIFIRELGALYEGFATGAPVELPELPIQYADFAVWQQDWLKGEVLEEQLGFWREHLNGNPPTIELTTDFPRRQSLESDGKTLTRFLSKEMETSLRALAKRQEATLFMVLLAAFKTLLYRYTGQEDIVVNSPMAGRNRVEVEGLIGFFVNILPLRTKVSGNSSFTALLRQVREVTLAGCAHQEAPFDYIVKELRPKRAASHTPFARVIFMNQNSSFEKMRWRSGNHEAGTVHSRTRNGSTGAFLEIQFLDAHNASSKFELSLNVQETTLGLAVHAEYNTGLFAESTVERLLQHFEILLGGILENPARRLSELPILSDSEKKQLLVDWNNTASNYPREKPIHQLFEEAAARMPDAPAAVFGARSIRYAELNTRANQLAHYLARYQIKPNTPIGMCLEPSVEMVVAMLAILKAGGAYVPLDPGYPTERLAFMLEDTRTPVVLTRQELRERIPGDFPNVICLERDWKQVERERRDNPTNRVAADDLAYVMYTSGSTGQPKGVRVWHRGVTRLVLNTNYVQLNATERLGQISNISFDAATFEIWGALLNGAQLVGIATDVAISPKEFARELKEKRITTIFLTTALFGQIAIETPDAFESLRTVIVGGEVMDPNFVRAVLRSRPPRKLLHAYGPTENTTFTSYYEIEDVPEDATDVPIGRPIANTQIYILDSALNPVPIGIPGELYTGGDGIADGYWNRPELTSEKFVPNPFVQQATTDSRHSALLYRTGDLARYLPNGDIQFLGRIDEQVKIRGFRIELGEIEMTLRSHPAIRECVVTVCGSGAGDKRLVAYFVPKKDVESTAGELRIFVKRTLPDYMVPSAFVAIQALPLSPNGKLDRKALPKPGNVPGQTEGYQHPRDEVETRLARIWEEVLETRPVGIRDKFFDLGGHSLLAVRLVSRIEREFSRKVRVATIFQCPTIEGLAEVIRDEEKEARPKSSIVEIQAKGERPPLFLVHGAGGGMFWGYANLSRHVGTSQPIYAFRSRGLDGLDEFSSIEEMAAQYVADLRRIQPNGPYYLGGYCFGGIVAYEMARQIVNGPGKVALLALFNCAPPNSRYARVACTPIWGLRFLKNLFYWGGYVWQLTPPQRREFGRWKWHRLKQRFRRNPQTSDGRVDVGDLVDLSSFAPEERKVWEEHIRALLKYQPKPYEGKVHLFRSPGHSMLCSFAPDYGWSEFAKGGVVTSIVSGAHEKILEEPCVANVAAALDKLLEPGKQPKILHEPRVGGCGEFCCERRDGGRSLPPHPSPLPWGEGAPKQCSFEDEDYGSNARSSSVEAAKEHCETDLAYWKKRLAGAPALFEILTDHSRPPTQSGHTETESRVVSNRFVAGSAQDRLIAAFAAVFVLLRRYTNQEDMLVAASFSAERSENPVVVRVNTSGNSTATELLQTVRECYREGLTHRAVPFSKLVQELCPNPDSSYHPICQVAFSSEQSPVPGTKFDLHFQFEGAGQGMLIIRYAKDLFEAETIKRLLAQWETVLGDVLAHPERKLSELAILPPQEQRLLSDWNNTRKEYPHNKTLFQLFEEQVARTPDAEALVCGNVRLTYLQLLSRANGVARQLRTLGVGPESLVGICLERCAEMVTGILGTLKAGGAYVPMDPAYPRERIAFMLEDSKPLVLLTQTSLCNQLPKTTAHVICLDTFDWAAEGKQIAQAPDESAITNHQSSLAYVIYTSGSTGQPKGVAIEHRNAVAFVSWAKDVFTPKEVSGVLASTSICFDLSVFEMFVPLCWGGKVILAENALALPSLPAANEVKLINTVPSAIRELLRIKGVPQSVRVVNLAGEPLPTSLVNDMYRQTAVQKVYDLYGPTETTTYSTFTLRKPGEPPSIGRPLSNEQVYLLDSQMRLVPIGVQGDLYIGGDGVARGYLNRPELTAEKFIANPFTHLPPGSAAGNRLYKTGDLARWRADGRLEFLGRRDHQVKIRGFRVELGEIETVLKKQSGVGDAAVLAREDQPGIKRLVAYVASSNPSINAEKLREGLKTALPAYMVPSAFVLLERLPLTPNGKVDRKALPAPSENRSGLSEDFVAPSSSVEQQLAAIWRDVLQLNEIGVRDNFFDLGGNSLLAVQIISRIRESFDAELPMSALFDAPTISVLAQQIGEHPRHSGSHMCLPLEPVGRDGCLPVSFVQERLWFLEQMRPENCAYNVPIAFRLRGPLELDAFQKAFDLMVARHESLRTTFCVEDGNLTQAISPAVCIKIAIEELRDESRAQELVEKEAQLGFDLSSGPLIRAKLLRLGKSDHIFVVVMHHIISDGWSLGIFLREFEAAYRAIVSGSPEPALPPLSVQYADFAAWRRESLQGISLEKEIDFWKEKLEGAPPAIAIPTDSSASSNPDGKAGHVNIEFPTPLTQAILKFGHQDGTTPFVVLMTALAITLQKWTNQRDMVIGTVVAGRNRRELENVIGCFMNFLPLRILIQGTQTGREVLAAVRRAAVEAQNHQDCPFEKIVEAVNPERKLNRNPLYNVALLFQNFSLDFFNNGPLRATPVPAMLDAALVDLRFEAEQTAQGISLLCEYNAGLFEPATIEQLVSAFHQSLQTLVHNPETLVNDFPGLAPKHMSSARPGPLQTIAVAGTFTAEPVAEPLRYWVQQLDLGASIEFAPYNQAFQQLLDPNSLFGANQAGLNVILLRFEDWSGSPEGTTLNQLEYINRNVREFVAAIKEASSRSAVPYLVCLCPASNDSAMAIQIQSLESSLAAQLESLAGVHVLTSSELARLYPVAEFYDPSGDELGHVPYTPHFFTGLATAVARKFYALNRAPHKVIVLDLDQTLWSGVCGEDGPTGIRLDEPRIALQRFMRAQQEAGMLLCLCSKNNEEDVWPVFEQRAEMPLRREHFAAWRVNWNSKSENLKALAKELQLGLDSFIFVDDNPVECAEVEANCPEVLTLQLPEEPTVIPQFLEHCWVFDRLKLTSEDSKRAEMYRQNEERAVLRSRSANLRDFLAGLRLRIQIEPLTEEKVPRVAQLTQRTNQFNCTTLRRTEGEVRQLLNRSELLTVSVSDRFGDYGLTGEITFEQRENSLDVESFLLSCRILGRGVEHRVVARLGELAQERKLEWVEIHFNPSPKNQPAFDFLQSIGEKFRQSLNGGYVFRFPAAYARQVRFEAQSNPLEAASSIQQRSIIVQSIPLNENPAEAGTPYGDATRNRQHATRDCHPARFSLCRQIALELNDPARIHANIESKAVIRSGNRTSYSPPGSELEIQLCEIWQKLLHIDRVGISDNFFEIGGHSLLAVRLFAEINRVTGKKVPLVMIFQSPTIERLARLLGQGHAELSRSLIVPLQPEGSKPPLFLVHGAGGDILWGYANLSAHMPGDQPIYGIKSSGQAGREEFTRIEDMAACYVEELRAFQPHGPYYIGGYCFGGNVAYEMARQLRAGGENVAFVALLDSAPANAGYEKIRWWAPRYGVRFARNLLYWLADFAQQTSRERREFVIRKLRVLGRNLTRRRSSRTVDLESVIDVSHFPENELRLWGIHLQALVEHAQQPYPGEVLLLRTRGQPLLCSLETDFCWRKLAQGGVQVTVIPGSHENVFMEPNVRTLAKELSFALAHAQRRAATRPAPSFNLQPSPSNTTIL